MVMCFLQSCLDSSIFSSIDQQKEDHLQPKALRICEKSGCDCNDSPQISKVITTNHMEIPVSRRIAGSSITLFAFHLKSERDALLSLESSKHMWFLWRSAIINLNPAKKAHLRFSLTRHLYKHKKTIKLNKKTISRSWRKNSNKK